MFRFFKFFVSHDSRSITEEEKFLEEGGRWWGEVGRWERVIVSQSSPWVPIKYPLKLNDSLPTFLVSLPLSQHSMFWRYSWIVVNNYIHTNKLFLIVYNLALSTSWIKWCKFVGFHEGVDLCLGIFVQFKNLCNNNRREK